MRVRAGFGRVYRVFADLCLFCAGVAAGMFFENPDLKANYRVIGLILVIIAALIFRILAAREAMKSGA